MNGAETLVETLLGSGVDVCFANPGTSEMHFVAALDKYPDMRCVLCLFEGGATGAADGYYRMKENVAATLLHLGPGLANGVANLHNARKAKSGVVNIVGDHADYHLKYDSPLKGDLAGISNAISHWTRAAPDALSVAQDGAVAVQAARSNGGQISTLILPANTAWNNAEGPATYLAPKILHRPSNEEVVSAAKVLSQPDACLFLGHKALYGKLAQLAGRIAAKSGCEIVADFLVPRIERGQGAIHLTRMNYPIAENLGILKHIKHMVLCGSNRPVAFFAYPNMPSTPEPHDCHITELCAPDMDYAWTLQALADELGAAPKHKPKLIELDLPEIPTGAMSLEKVGEALAAILPENAIVVDESVTSSGPLVEATKSARNQDWMHVVGGAIGQGLPVAVGAAIACPGRKVVSLMGDGSAMYTLQSLWTMAREELDVVNIIFANRGYQILHLELANVGVLEAGRNAGRMFDVDNPTLDWVSLAKGHGVSAERVTDADEFVKALRKGLATKEPYLIEVVC
ncbi:MAG: acetolactate synthase large subunit [Hyphomicrobiales bacterium]|uniref:acetolactate synthase large subunit n=1 Tax=Nisaea sp. TaxID=2024842 RepID=UPI0032742344